MRILLTKFFVGLQRLDDITRSLNGDLEIGDADVRSPSPDPVYDKNGVRVNTRVLRAKDKLLREKSDLIEECQKLRKNFVVINFFVNGNFNFGNRHLLNISHLRNPKRFSYLNLKVDLITNILEELSALRVSLRKIWSLKQDVKFLSEEKDHLR